jgi:tetratricopeptide (TPR) repeat protein
MAAKKKITTKDVLKSDPLFSFGERVYAYVQENARQLAAAGLVVLVVAGGVFLWQVSRSRTDLEARTHLSRALRLMPDTAASTAEREQGFTLALEQFAELAAQYGSTRSGQAARLYAGNCLFELQRYDEALEQYSEFLQRMGRHLDYLRPLAYEGTGYAYEAKGDYESACRWYEKQRRDPSAFTEPAAILNEARCYEALDERQLACERYREYLEGFPGAPAQELARTKKSDLCTSG